MQSFGVYIPKFISICGPVSTSFRTDVSVIFLRVISWHYILHFHMWQDENQLKDSFQISVLCWSINRIAQCSVRCCPGVLMKISNWNTSAKP